MFFIIFFFFDFFVFQALILDSAEAVGHGVLSLSGFACDVGSCSASSDPWPSTKSWSSEPLSASRHHQLDLFAWCAVLFWSGGRGAGSGRCPNTASDHFHAQSFLGIGPVFSDWNGTHESRFCLQGLLLVEALLVSKVRFGLERVGFLFSSCVLDGMDLWSYSDCSLKTRVCN